MDKPKTAAPPKKVKPATKTTRPRAKSEPAKDSLGSGSVVTPFGTPKQLADGGTKTTLAQRVHKTLMESLDEGILKPGQRIKAAELAKRLGLSRAPVREALHVLAGQGLVELLPDKGAVMRVFTLDDLIQIYEVTGCIAKVGVVAATERIHEGDNRQRVEMAIARIRAVEQAPPSPSYKFYLLLNDFHYLLNEIGEKPYVGYLLGILNIEYWNRFLASTIDMESSISGYIANYNRLADAVLAGDSRAAGAIMDSHVEWSIHLLEQSKDR
ncbi:GntR family transcriptional regulator [Govanella unica]|uniref:GntR family transcriptional regulator n=1 Tax=Govanella unica TaxID=2975056 RepID=A0A9X3TYN8_9PROT|nr:GntR family transcriptional regulator [Govania unica]MDA5194406.1 GntR family transcriptional regulator [Govania unica]